MVKVSITVQTYSGYRADERPISFTVVDRRFEVREILDQWQGEDHAYFKVIADDGNLYIIRHDKAADDWEMVMMDAVKKP